MTREPESQGGKKLQLSGEAGAMQDRQEIVSHLHSSFPVSLKSLPLSADSFEIHGWEAPPLPGHVALTA